MDTFMRSVGSFFGLLAIMFFMTYGSEAAIVNIEIIKVESPTFDGRSFGSVGQYEKLHGRAYGEVDPEDPHNSIITDIDLAPRNSNGKVEYSMDIFILKPIDMNRSNHKLFLDCHILIRLNLHQHLQGLKKYEFHYLNQFFLLNHLLQDQFHFLLK